MTLRSSARSLSAKSVFRLGPAAQPRGQQPGAAIAILEVGRMHQTLQE
ncbi:hypothetical protein [uncultured Thiocystis sp.]|nr:hypothetical protein [uncultured Thiocystis sp.]